MKLFKLYNNCDNKIKIVQGKNMLEIIRNKKYNDFREIERL